MAGILRNVDQIIGTNLVMSTAGAMSIAGSSPSLTIGNGNGRGVLTLAQSNTGTGYAGTICLVAKNGVERYLWITSAGALRISTDAPVADTDGQAV